MIPFTPPHDMITYIICIDCMLSQIWLGGRHLELVSEWVCVCVHQLNVHTNLFIYLLSAESSAKEAEEKTCRRNQLFFTRLPPSSISYFSMSMKANNIYYITSASARR